MSQRDRFEVKEEEGKFKLYLDGKVLGESRAHSDCDFAREVILNAFVDTGA